MSSESRVFPRHFRCSFLRNTAEAFCKRTKALKRSGRLEWETGKDGFEWLTISHAMLVGPVVTLQLREGNRANFYVQSARSADRGKVLVRLEDVYLVSNGSRVVEVFERTIGGLHDIASSDAEGLSEIRRIWKAVCMAASD